jgi:aerobic carbon-monoxide dehydrogenase large subunit
MTFIPSIVADFGAYNMLLTPLIPSLGAFVMGGCYKIPAVQTDIVSVFTNKCPTDAIRGAGRPEATHMIEVTLDQVAGELGMDPPITSVTLRGSSAGARSGRPPD